MAFRPAEDREADVTRAKEMRAKGMTIAAIANHMGLARTTVSNYLNHPETGQLYRHRKRQWKLCPGCGRRMSYGASRCMKCRGT